MILPINKIACMDAVEYLRGLPDKSVHLCVTSPPYFNLRDYKVAGQIGLEKTPGEFISSLSVVFQEVYRVLKNDGNLYVVIGDSYSTGGNGDGGYLKERAAWADKEALKGWRHTKGFRHKELIGIPWMLAFRLRSDGWILREEIIWNKPNALPQSVNDRCTRSHETIFHFVKKPKYFYCAAAIAEPLVTKPSSWGRKSKKDPGAQAIRSRPMFSNGRDGTDWGNGETRNKRSVWEIPSSRFPGEHFATFPNDVPGLCIRAACPEDGVVLDPFMGAGTTALVALSLGRQFIGCELNPTSVAIAERRLRDEAGILLEARG